MTFWIRCFSCAALIAFEASNGGAAATLPVEIDGRVAVGSSVYTVLGSARVDENGLWRLSIELLVGGSPKSSIVARVNASGGEIFVDGAKSQVPAPIAQDWIKQLTNGWEQVKTDPRFHCQQVATAFVCDSTGLESLAPGVPGRQRYTFGHGSVQMRFFSVAEWNNTFNDYVEVSVNLRRNANATDR